MEITSGDSSVDARSDDGTALTPPALVPLALTPPLHTPRLLGTAKRPRPSSGSEVVTRGNRPLPTIILEHDESTLRVSVLLHQHPAFDKVDIKPAKFLGTDRWLFESELEQEAPPGDNHKQNMVVLGAGATNLFSFCFKLPCATCVVDSLVAPRNVTQSCAVWEFKKVKVYPFDK